ncbi:MAG: hypothetical protein ABF617_14015 [Gluconobacter japonicus]|uniref:hypothetical protein n=1 Tax=Gluconobacter japonicus TaxID=376620 RepID=UPI0039E8AA5C
MTLPYVELQVTSSFSFLRSGSQPDELIFQAKALGYDTIGLTDWNTVAGVIRAHLATLPEHVQSLLDLPEQRAGEEEIRFLALTMLRQPGDLARLHALAAFSAAQGLACVVTGDVLYHDARRHVLQDVVTAIREGCTVDDLGNRRHVHADRHLKAPEEQARLFAAFPDALANTRRIAEACAFSLDDLTYQYPTETERTGESAQDTLTRLVEAALPRRYPAGAPPEVEAQIAHELRLIGSLSYAPYFLTVHTIVRHARSLGSAVRALHLGRAAGAARHRQSFASFI